MCACASIYASGCSLLPFQAGFWLTHASFGMLPEAHAFNVVPFVVVPCVLFVAPLQASPLLMCCSYSVTSGPPQDRRTATALWHWLGRLRQMVIPLWCSVSRGTHASHAQVSRQLIQAGAMPRSREPSFCHLQHVCPTYRI
jgi:hypothetical protein